MVVVKIPLFLDISAIVLQLGSLLWHGSNSSIDTIV